MTIVKRALNVLYYLLAPFILACSDNSSVMPEGLNNTNQKPYLEGIGIPSTMMSIASLNETDVVVGADLGVYVFRKTEDTWNPVSMIPFGDDLLDPYSMVKIGDYVYATSNSGLKGILGLDMRDPLNPLVGSWKTAAVDTDTRLSALSGGYIAANQFDSTVKIYEVQTNGNLSEVASISKSSSANFSFGSRLVLSDEIFDVSDPLNPASLATLPDNYTDIVVKTDSILFASNGVDLISVDTSNLANVVELDSISSGGTINSFVVHDNKVFLSTSLNLIRVVDVSDPGNLVLLSAQDVTVDDHESYHPSPLITHGSSVLAVSWYSIYDYNLSEALDSQTPVLWAGCGGDGKLYFDDYSKKLACFFDSFIHIYDASSPEKIQFLKRANFSKSEPNDDDVVFKNDSLVFFSDAELHRISTENTDSLSLNASISEDPQSPLQRISDYVFFTGAANKIHRYSLNFSNADLPLEFSHASISNCKNIHVIGEVVFCADSSNKELHQLSYTNDAFGTFLNSTFLDYSNFLGSFGDGLIIGLSKGLALADTTSDELVFTDAFAFDEVVTGFCQENNRIYANQRDSGLMVYEFYEDGGLDFIGAHPTFYNQASGLPACLGSNWVAFGNGSGGVRVIKDLM